ncbi:MAG: UvrD-helicase domain-containing protein, partial [Spirochaetales bacterium]|nr:UvrD-helicase domain-containing protein [Candidatus Physcosoma equi]
KLQEFIQICLNNGFDITSPSSTQREAILSNDKCVIPAGAGSGKTTVLTYRFLRLLLDDEIEEIHSDEILTITFTKAATANMKAKIYRLLKKAADKGILKEEELERFSNAEISTTDSFCSRIARMDSTRYGIAPDFIIEDQAELESFARRTIRTILEKNLEDPTLKAMLEKYSVKDFEDAFNNISTNFINLARPLPSDPEEIFRLCRDSLIADFTAMFEVKLQKLREDITSFQKDYSEYENLQENFDSMATMLENMEAKNYSVPVDLNTRKKTLTKDAALDAQMSERRKSINEQYKKLAIYAGALDEKNIERMRIFSKLYGAFQEEILRHKRINGFLTFHDVMTLSIHILKDNKEIRDAYRKKYKRIMVDEFQDNNSDNKNLVYLLSANDGYTGEDYPTVSDIQMEKIFMVGDEKQSIYK